MTSINWTPFVNLAEKLDLTDQKVVFQKGGAEGWPHQYALIADSECDATQISAISTLRQMQFLMLDEIKRNYEGQDVETRGNLPEVSCLAQWKSIAQDITDKCNDKMCWLCKKILGFLTKYGFFEIGKINKLNEEIQGYNATLRDISVGEEPKFYVDPPQIDPPPSDNDSSGEESL